MTRNCHFLPFTNGMDCDEVENFVVERHHPDAFERELLHVGVYMLILELGAPEKVGG